MRAISVELISPPISTMAIGEKTLPDIIYDGVVDPKKGVDGELPKELAIIIRDNGVEGIVVRLPPRPFGTAVFHRDGDVFHRRPH